MDNTDDVQLDESILNTPIGQQPPEETTDVETPAQTDQSAATDTTTEAANQEEADAKTATEDTKEETPASETQPETSAEETTQPQTAEERAKENARQGWLRRQQEKEAADRFDKSYVPKDLSDFQTDDIDPRDARIEALEAQRQFDLERTRVIQLTTDMTSDAREVEEDFGIFNAKSPDYDEEFAKQAMEEYKQYANLDVDDQGNILRADVPLYSFMKQRFDSYNRGLTKGTSQREASNQQMLARTENPGGSSSTQPRSSDEDLEERIGNRPLTSFR